ncbi:MAG: (d)CMP kinase [Atribacterota bacterium]|nr:(d)CMP kinase [Atribacterota bacterium]MDD4896653.1 (d)CMP kinase [Atribacterota bacterium]MDD5637680.1 (d)CMP kinase [Atribacterota bacterium]
MYKKNIGLIITIDGPAGAGKSTVAKELAHKLDFVYINTGDLYRYITYYALYKRLDVNNAQAMNKLSKEIVRKYTQEYSYLDLISHIKLITAKIHSPEINKKVSFVARHSLVREKLIPLQRMFAQDGSVVMEGRDIGTVIIPYADLKFYLTADEQTRTMRRYKELHEKGYQITFQDVKKEITCRDYIDSKRKTAPLTRPEDAILIDTTNKNVNEVVEEMLRIIKNDRIKQ